MKDTASKYAELISAFNQHAWSRARQLASQLLPLLPKDGALHYLGGIAYMQLQEMTQALDCLRKATKLEPNRADFAAQYAKALAMVRAMSDAQSIASRTMALSPKDPFVLDTLGVVFIQAHALEQATTAFRHAVALMPNHAPYRFNLAYSLIAMGDMEAAERELETSIGLDPRYWKAHLRLAELRRQTLANNHLDRLSSLLSKYENNTEAQIYLNMAQAKEYEDTSDYPKAFDHFVRGKSAGRSSEHASIMKRDANMFEALTRAFPEESVENRQGDPTNEPIFIVGMPRTGTTLMDRIISSHPDVYSAGELHNFHMTVQAASGSKMPFLFDPEIIARARDINWKQLGAAYLSSTRPATAHKTHFVDKMPHNFLNAGFIAHALPNAKIICLRRDPLDTCLSNFRNLFEGESSYYEYSFDLLDTGRYYILFDRLMRHWQRVFPGRILEMQYETLVASQEVSIRRLLEFCGLSWNDACLHSENNPAPVNTPNAWQVRAPIYQTSVQRWKKYESQLSELKDLLRAADIKLDP